MRSHKLNNPINRRQKLIFIQYLTPDISDLCEIKVYTKSITITDLRNYHTILSIGFCVTCLNNHLVFKG